MAESVNDNQKKFKNSKNAFSFIFLICVVLLISGLTIVSVMNTGYFQQFDTDAITAVFSHITGKNNDPSTKQLTVLNTLSTVGVSDAYVSCGKYLYVSNGRDITVYDTTGEPVHKEIIEIKDPVTASNAEYALIGDRQERTVYMYKGLKRIALLEVTGDIRMITVNDNGYIGIICDDATARSKISFYNYNGKKICDIYKRETLAVNTSVLSSGKEYVVYSVGILGTGFISNFEFSDFLSDSPHAAYNNSGVLYSILFPTADMKVIAANETGIYCFDRNATLVWSVEPGNINAVNRFKNGIVYTAQNITGDYTTVFSDLSGNKLGEYSYGRNIIGIYTYDNIIAVNYGREIAFFDGEGSILKKYSSKSDISDVRLLGRTNAVSITANDMTFIKFN